MITESLHCLVLWLHVHVRYCIDVVILVIAFSRHLYKDKPFT